MSEGIGPEETAFRVELTATELRTVYAALRSFYDDFGHEEHDVRARIRAVMAKLPDESSLR